MTGELYLLRISRCFVVYGDAIIQPGQADNGIESLDKRKFMCVCQVPESEMVLER
ncbi:MAG: hypothetical protein V7L30_04765 [Nostoc sp.]